MQTIAHPTTAEEIVSGLRRIGFTPGAPAAVPAEWLAIDRRMARAMKCGGCHKRGLRLEPFQRGGEYRGVLSCVRCGFGEEA